MYNQVNLIGRLTEDPEFANTETYITVSVQSNYRNADGEYESDLIKCLLPKGLAKTTTDYCKKDDLLSIRGQIKTDNTGQSFVFVDKVIFLTSEKDR